MNDVENMVLREMNEDNLSREEKMENDIESLFHMASELDYRLSAIEAFLKILILQQKELLKNTQETLDDINQVKYAK